jgi:topoisomerase-4 subunit A
VDKVQKATQVRRSFKINVTHRTSAINDGIVNFETRYLSLSVPELRVSWLRERLQLEKRSLEHRIAKQNAAILYSDLLIYASNSLDIIFKALRQTDSKAYLMKHMKLSGEQADQILELKVRQLSKLDQDSIKAKREEQRMHLKELQGWLAKPRQKVSADTSRVLEAINKDIKFEESKNKKMSVT